MLKYLIGICLFAFYMTHAFAQQSFNTCTGLYLNQEFMSEDYSPRSTASLKLSDKGILTVNEVAISGEGKENIKAGKAIPFRVAIKDKRTQTIFLFSQETHTSLEVSGVLKRCNKGDQLLILSMDDKYSVLPAEILVE